MKSGARPEQIAIQDYTYQLPEEKIAKYPLKNRGESKLLVYANKEISVDRFKNLDKYFDENYVLVFNTSKVIPARLNFKNLKNKNIEVFCLEPLGGIVWAKALSATSSCEWKCLVGNLKQWKEEELLLDEKGARLKAKLIQKFATHVHIRFTWEPGNLCFADVLQKFGTIPIPPYLKRESERSDLNNYQTIYASDEGSVAAPTAGLHFTDEILKKLKEKSIPSVSLTLHVGAGTFMPVKGETLEDHVMHAEWIEIDKELIDLILNASQKKIIPVGTTSLRALESMYWMGIKLILQPDLELDGLEIKQWEVYEHGENSYTVRQSLTALKAWLEKHQLKKLTCKTQILIAPPYELKLADGIITNFHQPQSTLLLLIGAVVGEAWKKIYDYALQNEFRFLSYGDASLLLK